MIRRKYDCPTCWGTCSMESSDSTDDRTWDCSRCNGTGKLADRRRPDPALQGAVEALQEIAERSPLGTSSEATVIAMARKWLEANGHPVAKVPAI